MFYRLIAIAYHILFQAGTCIFPGKTLLTCKEILQQRNHRKENLYTMKFELPDIDELKRLAFGLNLPLDERKAGVLLEYLWR